MPAVEACGTWLHDKHIQRAILAMLEMCEPGDKSRLFVAATGVRGSSIAYQNAKFRHAPGAFLIDLPDGMPFVWIGRLMGSRRLRRCLGPSVSRVKIIASKDMGIRHFVGGGGEDLAEEGKRAPQEGFDNRSIIGSHSHPSRELTGEDLMGLANDIKLGNAGIAWNGISFPSHEQCAFRLARYANMHFLGTVGAALDSQRMRLRQPSGWMQPSGLEWPFRLNMRQRRPWNRQVKMSRKFIAHSAAGLWKHLA